MKIHFLESGDIDFSKVTASIEEINYQIHYLSTQCELEEDEFQANEAELNHLCEIREYLEGMQKSFQTTFGVDVVDLPTQNEQLPDGFVNKREKAMYWWNNQLGSAQKTQLCDTNTEWLGIRRWESLTGREIEKLYEEYWEENLRASEIAFPKPEEIILNEFNLPTISKNGFATDEVPILPDSYEIIHANPLESTNYQFVAKVYAYSLDNAFVNSQNGFTDLAWIQNFHGIDAKPCRSTSVGDIIGIDGKYYLVKGIGFEEVDSPFPMNEI